MRVLSGWVGGCLSVDVVQPRSRLVYVSLTAVDGQHCLTDCVLGAVLACVVWSLSFSRSCRSQLWNVESGTELDAMGDGAPFNVSSSRLKGA